MSFAEVVRRGIEQIVRHFPSGRQRPTNWRPPRPRGLGRAFASRVRKGYVRASGWLARSRLLFPVSRGPQWRQPRDTRRRAEAAVPSDLVHRLPRDYAPGVFRLRVARPERQLDRHPVRPGRGLRLAGRYTTAGAFRRVRHPNAECRRECATRPRHARLVRPGAGQPAGNRVAVEVLGRAVASPRLGISPARGEPGPRVALVVPVPRGAAGSVLALRPADSR